MGKAERRISKPGFLLDPVAIFRLQWFVSLGQLQGSVIPAVLPRVVICALFALLIALLDAQGLPVAWPVLGGVVPSIVIGLLLVFRTNTAYERFWEGRKLWGNMVNAARNLARQIWVGVEVQSPADQLAKQQALGLIVGFAIATKLHLRGEPINQELAAFLTATQFQKLQRMNNPPLEIAFWLGDYLQVQQARGNIHPYRQQSLVDLLDKLVDVLGGCERILKTPLPMAYAIHLKQVLLIYCFALPFQVVSDLGAWTALVVGLIAFAVFGIEEIGLEIENPFGRDPNDLPLDQICQTMERNIQDLMSLTPSIADEGQQSWQITTLAPPPKSSADVIQSYD